MVDISSFSDESIEQRLFRDLQAFDVDEALDPQFDDRWQPSSIDQTNTFDNGCSVWPEPSIWQNAAFEQDLRLLDSVPFIAGSTKSGIRDLSWSSSNGDTPSSRHSSAEDPIEPGFWQTPYFTDQTLLGGGGVASRPNVCAECEYPFPTSQALEDHARARTHQAYACNALNCGRSYSRRDTYARHRATHKGFDAHVCEHCPIGTKRKVFKRRDHLIQHVRNCHPAESPRRCRSPSNLRHAEDTVRQTPVSSAASSASLVTPLQPGVPNVFEGRCCETREVANITLVLNDILGENSPALRMLDQRPNTATSTQIARDLAQLALFQPNDQTRERLRTLDPNIVASSRRKTG